MSDIMPMPTAQNMFSGGEMYYTSLDVDKLENKKIVLRCLGECDERVKQCINAKITVANIFAHMVELANDETGEISQQPRVVLISPDGLTYECVSQGVYRDVSALIWLFGKPPWNPPLELIPRLIDLKGGRNMLKLELVDETKPAKSKRVS